MSGTIFSVYLTSATSALFAALRNSVLPVALKRWRNGCKKREERIVATSKQTLNQVLHDATSASTVHKSNCIEKSGDTQAPFQHDWKSTVNLVARERNRKDAALSSPVWQKDAETDKSTRRLVAAVKARNT